MAPKTFTRNQLIHAATTSPWTKDFRHLLPIPKNWLRRTSIRDPVIKSVRPKDLIKYWNVVPGDQIRLLGDKENTLHEVLSINRISNRVFVRGVANSGEDATQRDKIPQSKNYHYSRCQLFVGNYEFPPPKGSTEPEVIPVFAQRLGTSPPFWNHFLRRFDWQRFATRTIPIIPHLRGERVPIPWPKPDKPVLPEPGLYDTVKKDVMKVTYKPPPFTRSLKGLIPRPPSEADYLKSLYNPNHKASFGDSPPVEVYLHKELANPHSRAKKLRRWKSYQNYQKSMLLDYINAELDQLGARRSDKQCEREARAEAAWKWREKLAEEKESERKRRWKHKASEARMERKKARRKRKEVKQRQRLTDMVLKEQPNQVIPNYKVL